MYGLHVGGSCISRFCERTTSVIRRELEPQCVTATRGVVRREVGEWGRAQRRHREGEASTHRRREPACSHEPTI